MLPSVLVSNLMGAAGTAFLVNELPLWQLILLIVLLAALLFGLILFFIRRFCFRGREGTPDSMAYAFIFLLVRIWLGRRQRVEIDDALLRELEPPYILLSNHESFEDFYYISQMAHPRNPSYLVNEYYCTRPLLKTLARRGGILSKKLFTPDLAAPLGILRTIRRGYPVVIFPEGRLSPDGRSNPIVESGAALYRRLKTPLVLLRIDGAYWAHPKWRKKRFRSDIRLSVRRVLRPEELSSMSDAQLDELIRAELYNDASAHGTGRYPQKDKAAGLEGLLYRCADCGALYRTEGVGCELRCRACGAVHRLDESYRFTDEIGTIPGYCDAIRRMGARRALPARGGQNEDLRRGRRPRPLGKGRMHAGHEGIPLPLRGGGFRDPGRKAARAGLLLLRGIRALSRKRTALLLSARRAAAGRPLGARGRPDGGEKKKEGEINDGKA